MNQMIIPVRQISIAMKETSVASKLTHVLKAALMEDVEQDPHASLDRHVAKENVSIKEMDVAQTRLGAQVDLYVANLLILAYQLKNAKPAIPALLLCALLETFAVQEHA